MRSASRVLFVALLFSGPARAGDEADVAAGVGERLRPLTAGIGKTPASRSVFLNRAGDEAGGALLSDRRLDGFHELSAEGVEPRPRRLRGDGRGADIAFGSLVSVQTRFIESDCPGDCEGQPCNVVLLLWQEDTFNPDGVAVLLDGNLLGTVPGQPEANLPAINRVRVTEVAGGLRTFRIEDPNGGTSDEVEIDVLDKQPFNDVANVEVTQGPVAQDGTCSIVLCWNNTGPSPTSLGVVANGVVQLQQEVGGFALLESIVFSGAQPGGYVFQVPGLLELPENPRGLYRGCFVESELRDITCEPVDCPAPLHPLFVQLDYDDDTEAANNLLFAVWFNGVEAYPGGLNILEGDAVLANVSGDLTNILLPVPPGDFDFGLQGDCGGGSVSEVTRDQVNVLPETPWSGALTDGPPLCEFDPETASTTVAWTAAQDSDFIFLWRSEDPADPTGGFSGANLVDFLPGTFAGTGESFTVEETTEDTVVSLQFFRYDGDEAYGSEPITCEEPEVPEFFVRGLCSGSPTTSNPQITDAIVLLSSLFTGGEDPPCRQACDADGNDALQVTDAIFLLTFLFLGGDQPPGWMDRVPTCSPVDEESELDCVTPLARCVEEGPAPAP